VFVTGSPYVFFSPFFSIFVPASKSRVSLAAFKLNCIRNVVVECWTARLAQKKTTPWLSPGQPLYLG
tara:strand:+ start:451 stop:651 length:201 start_codon:yes stop_codon:yes gene_type:complete